MASLPQTQLQDGMPEVTSSRNHGADAPLTGEPAVLSYQWPVHLPFAHVLLVIDVMDAGSLAKRFQAMQQASTIAS